METTKGYIRIIGIILGLFWNDGKENGNHYSIIGTLAKKR